MAAQKISEMTEAIILQDEDYVPIVQSNLNKKIKIELLRDYNQLHNKPILNGVTIENNKKLSDYNVVKANQGIKVNSSTNQTLELEVPSSTEMEERSAVNKAITIATADKMAKETAHQTMTKEYLPNSQANLKEGENQPVSYKAVKTYVDLLESKVDINEESISKLSDEIANKSDFSGSYNDLSNKPTIPTKTSQLTNDSNFLTEIPSEYVTETELNAKGYLTEHQDISGKQNKNDSSLETTDKTIVGAINENKARIDEKITNPTSGTIGQVLAVKSVDDNGKPTEYETVEQSSGGSYTLPIATPTQLGGVKPVAKTDEMTQEVGVDEAGGLFTEPCNLSGITEAPSLIIDYTVEEAVSDIIFTSDTYPELLNAQFLMIKISRTEVSTDSPYVHIKINDSNKIIGQITSTKQYSIAIAYNLNGLWFLSSHTSATKSYLDSRNTYSFFNNSKIEDYIVYEPINQLELYSYMIFNDVGTNIKVYAC